MSKDNDPERVWDLIEKIGLAMFVTKHEETMDGRPLKAHPDRDSGLIYLMVDSDHVLCDTAKAAQVLLSFASKSGNEYLALDGVAEITDDRAKIRDLWSPWAKAFWDSPDNPAIRLITVTPGRARYWDGPNVIVATLAIAAAAATGKEPHLGSTGDVQLQ